MAIQRGHGPAVWHEGAFITERTHGLVKVAGPEVFNQIERQHGFEHWYFHSLSFAGALAMKQRHADR